MKPELDAALKRALDLALAGGALAVTWPALLALAAAIKLEDGGSALYVQERVGRFGRPFQLLKFRTMRQRPPQAAGLQITVGEDDRITRLGRLLRRTRLDELPQLWNIVKGEMSFVGPRPALYNQEDLITLRSDHRLHKLIPGLTGWAQVNGRDDLSIPEKVLLEVEYMHNKSFWFDLKILWLTFLKVINRKGVSH